MSRVIVCKEKNPKRVAAGKALAERQKKYKEFYERNGGECQKCKKYFNPELINKFMVKIAEFKVGDKNFDFSRAG